ncbi:MAG: ABC transporter permease [Acholeplasmatales bacterium]|nr:ABC transporter permease [Acholeplasmatales bacterium]
MKYFDRYKLSLHNINNNKSRSILTTIIVYIISLLLTVILSIGISFSLNTNNIIKKYYSEATEFIDVSYFRGEYSTIINNSNYSSLYDVILKHDSSISYTSHNANLYDNNLYLEDHGYFPSNFVEITEGRAPVFSDANTNKVLVSAEYAREYYDLTGEKLDLNDTINYSIRIDLQGDFKFVETELEVIGIYKNKNVEISPFSSENIIMDIQYLLSLDSDLYAHDLHYYYDVTKVGFNINEFSDNLLNLVADLRDSLGEGYIDSSIYSSAENDIFVSKILIIIVIVMALVFSLILILLSIGSLANTIMISVDKNKKFIGLLKALGLNEKDLKSVIKMESITTICLGVILAFVTIVVAKPILTGLNDMLVTAIFSEYLIDIDYEIIFNIPIYVPAIVMAFFIVFTLIFARGSMAKIAKTDPMAVISEVA